MITHALVCAHLRVAPDGDDAELIQFYTDAAVRRVSDHIDRSIYPGPDLPEGAPAGAVVMTTAIANAILLLVAAIYDDRVAASAASEVGMPPEAAALLAPYKRWSE